MNKLDVSIYTLGQLGALCRGARRHRGLTQAQMAIKPGVAQSAVSKLESAPGRARIERLFQYLAALDLEINIRDRSRPKMGRKTHSGSAGIWMNGEFVATCRKQQLRMAMAIWGKNRHSRWTEFNRRHWHHTAADLGLGGIVDETTSTLADTTATVVAQVGGALPQGFPQQVADTILQGLVDASRQL